MEGAMANCKKTTGVSTPVIKYFMDGYRVCALDDGRDYPDLARRFARGGIPSKRIDNNPEHHRREVHLVELDGRKYVIKKDLRPGKEWSQRLWQMLIGPRDSSVMKRVNRAVDAGCDVIPRTFLVAEKVRWRLVVESVQIIEFIEGRPPDFTLDPPEIKRDIAAAMTKLYSYRLAHTDIRRANFLVIGNGVKIIDLTFRGTYFMGRMKGIVRLKARFKVDIPLEGWCDRTLFAVVEGKEGWNRFWRRFGSRFRALWRRFG